MKVTSQAMSKVTYDRDTKTLRVQFNSGKWYSYLDVPRKTAEDFQQAFSKGSYFQENIKNNFKSIKH